MILYRHKKTKTRKKSHENKSFETVKNATLNSCSVRLMCFFAFVWSVNQKMLFAINCEEKTDTKKKMKRRKRTQTAQRIVEYQRFREISTHEHKSNGRRAENDPFNIKENKTFYSYLCSLFFFFDKNHNVLQHLLTFTDSSFPRMLTFSENETVTKVKDEKQREHENFSFYSSENETKARNSSISAVRRWEKWFSTDFIILNSTFSWSC